MHGYQNVVVGGRQYGKPPRRDSEFFNSGKWSNFILPFLEDDCEGMTFVDFGCNYGVHMKLAREHGFETVVGIEQNEDLREVTSRNLGTDGQVIYSEINQDIFRNTLIADLPAADYVLMANFHYHVYASVFKHLVNLLRHKTRRVIVVSAEKAPQKLYRAEPTLEGVRRYFREWTEEGPVRRITVDDDPSPRPDLYSVMFKSNVKRIPLTAIRWGKFKRRFYRKVLRDMKASGERRKMTYPIVLRQDDSIADGHHRLASEEAEGRSTILAETF